MAVPSGIFMGPAATPSLNFITDNPVVRGYRSEDEFQRRQMDSDARLAAAAQALQAGEQRMAVTDFDVRERARRAQQEMQLDAALRQAWAGQPSIGQPNMGADDVTVPGQYSTGARSPDTYGPSDPSYQPGAVQSAPLAPSLPSDMGGHVNAPKPPGADYINTIIRQESSGKVDARPIDPVTGRPRSSALGQGQFIDGTWLAVLPEVARRIGREDIPTMPREQQLALRVDPEMNKVAIEVLAERNRKAMSGSLGRAPTDGDARLAHFLGAGGATRMLQAPPDDEASLHADPRAVTANPEVFAPGRKVRDVVGEYGAMPGAPAQAYPQQARMGQDTAPPADDATLPRWGRPDNDLLVGSRDPRMQAMQQALAESPGGGKMLYDATQKELSGRDAARLKVFELAGKGQAETAIALAEQLGVKINPNALRNQAVMGQIADLLKSSGSRDPAYLMEVIKRIGPDGNLQEAVRNTPGAPQPYHLQGGGTGGRSGGARFQFINRADGALIRVDKVDGSTTTVVEPGRPDQARARASAAAARAVKEGLITAAQMPAYMATMERRLMGEEGAGVELEAMMNPPKPPTPPSWWERTFGGATTPPAAAPASPASPAAVAPPAAPGPSQMIPGGAAPSSPDIFQQAQEAIRRGADPEAVRQRAMQQYGFDPLSMPGQTDAPSPFMGLTP